MLLGSKFFVKIVLNNLSCFCRCSTKESTPEQQVAKEEKFLFGSSNISSLSFQSVASSSLTSSPFGQKPSKSSPGFAGAGSPVFASQGATDHDESVTEEDHDGPHFEPIIPLPDKIDVKTGEEDEEVMFSHRAKLYRFVAEDKQWKERGVGEIKLLRNRQSGKMRVLMRRDQVFKICANHQITTDMKLQPNAGSEKSWVWSTLADFSEQECKAERLAVRFKSEDVAKQFKEKFEECQEMLKNQTSTKPVQEDKKQEEVKEDLFAKFKAAEGSWECGTCMVQNDSDKVECVACGSLKPGAEPPSQGQNKDTKASLAFGSASAASGSGFKFGSTSSTTASSGVTFGSGAPSTNAAAGFTFGSGTPTTNAGAGFTFGSGTPSTNAGAGLTFGSAAPSASSEFLFGSAASIQGDTQTVFSFGFSKQGGSVSEQTVESKIVVSQSDEPTPSESVDNDDAHVKNVQKGDATTDEAEQRSKQERASVDPNIIQREEKRLSSSEEEPLQTQQDEGETISAVESAEGDSSKPDETNETHAEEKTSSEGQTFQDILSDRETGDPAVKEEDESEAKVEQGLKQDDTKQPERISESAEEGVM